MRAGVNRGVTDKGKPGVTRGRKATDLEEAAQAFLEMAGLPKHPKRGTNSRVECPVKNKNFSWRCSMKSVKVLAVLVAGMVMSVVTGFATSVSQGSTAVFTVPTLIRLSLDTTTINFGALTLDDYDLGYKEALAAQVVRVWSNRTWTLTVVANSATWTGPWAKPASDLQLKVASVSKPGRVSGYASAYFGLSTSAQNVATGIPGGNIAFTMDFKVLVSWDNDVAGDYSLGFTYTLTAP